MMTAIYNWFIEQSNMTANLINKGVSLSNFNVNKEPN